MRSDNPECDFVEDFEHENGNYQCSCYQCGKTFFGYKRRVKCKACTHPINPNDPVLDFTDIFHYVKSMQVVTGWTDTEAGVMHHVLDMWQKKRYFEPTTFELSKVKSQLQEPFGVTSKGHLGYKTSIVADEFKNINAPMVKEEAKTVEGKTELKRVAMIEAKSYFTGWDDLNIGIDTYYWAFQKGAEYAHQQNKALIEENAKMREALEKIE